MKRVSTVRVALFVLLVGGGCGSPPAVEVGDLAEGGEQRVRLHFDNFMKSKSGAT